MSSTSTGPAPSSTPTSNAALFTNVAANKEPSTSNAAAPQRRLDPALTQGTWYRVPDFLTIRYRGAADARPITNLETQEELCRQLYAQLDHYIPKHSPKAPFNMDLGFVFDQEVVWPHVFPIIDIVCPTLEVCKGIRKELDTIKTRDSAGKYVLALESCGSDLPQDVLPFDFAASENHVTMKGSSPTHFSNFLPVLEELASKLGQLTGTIRLVHVIMGRTGGFTLEKAVRAYIKLSPTTKDLPFEDLSRSWAKWLRWDGRETKIFYAYKHLRCWKAFQLLHPDRAAKLEGRDTKRPASANAATNSSPTKSSKGKERQLD